MTHFIKTSALAIAASFALASAAHAGDTESEKAEMKADTPTQSQTTTLRIDVENEVRGALERGELIAVEGPDGRIYYNRYIAVEDLPDPELDIRVIDTIDINYGGQTFTNRIVEETN